MIGGNPGRVISGPILAVRRDPRLAWSRVMASLAVTGMFALAMIVAAARAAVVLPAGARIPLHSRLGRALLSGAEAGRAGHLAGGGPAVAGVLGGIAASSLAAGWVPGVRYVLAPAATGRAARLRGGRAAGAGAGNLGPFRIIL